jgi:gamma-D-glutamyl-L-lysine dipeptidyl-peptidase
MTSIIATASLLFANAPVADMREEPTHNSTMASQVYFMEPVRVVEERGDWTKIETRVDHYQGWVEKKILIAMPDEYLARPETVIARVNRLKVHVYDREDTEYGPILTLPFESRLEVIEQIGGANGRWIKIALPDGRPAFIQRGDVSFETKKLTLEEMCEFSRQFLGLPYTYGGRSSFGYDCSGFVQMLYRQMCLFIPRDSKDQIKWEGFVSTPLEKVKAGDLVFFGLAEDKIRHVGLCLDGETFIHSGVADNKPYITSSKLSEPSWNGSGRFAYRAARTLK